MSRRAIKIAIAVPYLAFLACVAPWPSVGHTEQIAINTAFIESVEPQLAIIDSQQPAIEFTPIQAEPSPPPASPSPPVPPSLKIVIGAKRFEVGHHIRIEFKVAGDVRGDFLIDFEPDIPLDDRAPDPADPTNPNKCVVTAPRGVYQMRVTAIGNTPGANARDEVMLEIFDPNPPMVIQPPAAASKDTKPEDRIREWVMEVRSQNLQADAIAVGKAAKQTAAEVRSGTTKPEGAVARWKVRSIIEMGSPAKFSPWDRSTDGRSFFDYVSDLFADVKAEQVPEVLENLDAILEGR